MKTCAVLGFHNDNDMPDQDGPVCVGGRLQHDYQDTVAGRDTARPPIGDVPETQVCCR